MRAHPSQSVGRWVRRYRDGPRGERWTLDIDRAGREPERHCACKSHERDRWSSSFDVKRKLLDSISLKAADPGEPLTPRCINPNFGSELIKIAI